MADRQITTTNKNNGKIAVLDDNADKMEQSHNKHKDEEKIYISKATPIVTIQLNRFDYCHPDKPDKLQ
jgi:hypothetical protein